MCIRDSNNRDRSSWPKGLNSLYDVDTETEGNPVALDTTTTTATAKSTTAASTATPLAATTQPPPSATTKRRSSSLSSSSNLFNINNNSSVSRTASRKGSVIGGGGGGVLVSVPEDDDAQTTTVPVEYLSSSEDDSDDDGYNKKYGGFANFHAASDSSPKSVRPIMVPTSQDSSAAQARFGAWVESRDLLVTAVYDPQADADREAEALRKIRHLSLIHISEPTRLLSISYAVFCLKKKKKKHTKKKKSHSVGW
eukprot:TRINITY_DN16632_c0_g1_i4.p1 TRINITY_DN16632_c0_g1~~TRINITY_DN16632_c0_g1_i4.p1  ORF type:complete len:253 (-),score=62.87 TRINITY_DN16632_c0_g1_i4:18-776(-)